MPKYLTWDAQNEMKLFHAILVVHNIKIDYVAVAKIFGSDVPASCIQSHMKRQRHKAATMGIITPKRTPYTRAKGPATGKARKKSGKAKEETDDTDEDNEASDGSSVLSKTSANEDSNDDGSTKVEPNLTMNQHKTISGRITKLRCSPRKKARLNYKAVLDSFSAEEDDISEEEKSGLDKKMPSNLEYNVNTVEEDIRVKAEI